MGTHGNFIVFFLFFKMMTIGSLIYVWGWKRDRFQSLTNPREGEEWDRPRRCAKGYV
jgi:hypothetical protein